MRIIHRFEDEELKSFNGKRKATVGMSYRAVEAFALADTSGYFDSRSQTLAVWDVSEPAVRHFGNAPLSREQSA